ncbi:recombinase family protein [Pendulispora brunnea]|uniref:Recombinase family protein n=1 Tax=Pendulispora brunnea TaxID=2905690 RepID=A0ABZ2K333_9BACT
MGTLEGLAVHEGPRCGVHRRTAEAGNTICIDLGNDAREVVEVTSEGWRIVTETPIKFVRPKTLHALPRPVSGGTVDELRTFFNLKEDFHFKLLVAWLIAALRPHGPYPILCLQAEHGAGKSTATRFARELVDPNPSPIRSAPREMRDLAIECNSSHVLAYDNLGGLPVWLSDALCRVSTGGGFATRGLFTDDEEVIFDFAMYLDGNSLSAIAKKLNEDAVTPSRVHVESRRTGWKDSTIRAVLHNETYAGKWRYKSREWRKLPGTNKRQPRYRTENEVITQEPPHLRIVDDEIWEAVQARLRAVSAHYTKSKDGKPKVRSAPGRRTSYLFSSLLHCGACGGKKIIGGGSGGAAYYRCEASAKRGTCTNRLSVREDVVRASLLDELRHRLASSDGIAYARKRIAERLGEFERERDTERREKRARLEKVEQRIHKLVDFIAEGHAIGATAKSVAEQLGTLERQADAERKALAVLNSSSNAPVKLPPPDEMLSLPTWNAASPPTSPEVARSSVGSFETGASLCSRSRLPLRGPLRAAPDGAKMQTALRGGPGRAINSVLSCAGRI